MKSANDAFKANDVEIALEVAKKAIQLDANRYEGYALTALVLEKQGHLDEAIQQSAKALEFAPAEKKTSLAAFRDSLEKQRRKPSGAQTFSPEARRKYDVLMLITADADKAKSAYERKTLLQEFMSKSAEFLSLAPMQTNIIVLRAAAALELDYPGTGWLIGRRLKELGLENSDDPAVRKVLAGLERKGWLAPNNISRDWNKWTTEQVRASAEHGDAEAAGALGWWYLWGMSGLATNTPEAIKWFRKAAEQGEFQAQRNLAMILENNTDNTEAVNLYRKAAAQGDIMAQYNVSIIYIYGKGVAKDQPEGVKWLRKAAEQGFVTAQASLAWDFENGFAVAKDETEAVNWYLKAAAQGAVTAQRGLGGMYRDGRGVAKDEAEAVKWFRKAAEQGDMEGQYLLGVMYFNGRTKDEIEAVKWYRKAAEQGWGPAQTALKSQQADSK